MKLMPAAGISFMCYEACKKILIEEEDEWSAFRCMISSELSFATIWHRPFLGYFFEPTGAEPEETHSWGCCCKKWKLLTRFCVQFNQMSLPVFPNFHTLDE
jgi:hypothetical protein